MIIIIKKTVVTNIFVFSSKRVNNVYSQLYIFLNNFWSLMIFVNNSALWFLISNSSVVIEK